ncbi:hypothetical protein NQ315_006774 [Exocentrus adspersus]|uniref:Uncharacterized protein n=1 Tax=Exocentrus adspersus TaxID=1586481 RepID=A0AAV8WBQ3_9CUCU|nr:hypothetical protein NQ315_006774 [Exocentrus adspersus]
MQYCKETSAIIKDIHKRKLKVVLEQANVAKYERVVLIKQLVNKERKVIKLSHDFSHYKNRDQDNIDKDLLIVLLEKEKQCVFDINVPLEASPAFRTNTQYREQQLQELSTSTVTTMPKHKVDKLLSLLKCKTKSTKLNKCLAHLYTSAKPPWNSPSVIMKAIKDSLLRRKWDNLVQLLLLLIHFNSVKYRPIIRHLCQIIGKCHPDIQNTGFRDQVDMIALVTSRQKAENDMHIKL